MTLKDASSAPAKVGRRWLVVAGVLVCIAIGTTTYAIFRLTNHGDPDPDGRILNALQSIEAAVPADATGLSRQDGEAHWDSCDGREGTFGWSPINVIITFKTPTPADVLVSQADRKMVAAGWTTGSPLDSPIGPGRHWTRTLSDATVAQAQLTPETTGDGQSIAWQLSAYAAAHGPRAHGC